MIRVLTSDRTSITLQKIVGDVEILYGLVSPNWYNTLYHCFTNIRTVKFKRTSTDAEVKRYLELHPRLHIYTVIDHLPILSVTDEYNIASRLVMPSVIADIQRLRIDEEDYIDEFGRHVYLASRIGTLADIDLRYDGKPEPELFHLQYIENG